MSDISTEELCRRFEQRLAAIRPLQVALRDRTLAAKHKLGREIGHDEEVNLAKAAVQIFDAVLILKESMAKGPSVTATAQWSRDIRNWQAAYERAAEFLGLPLEPEAQPDTRSD